MNAEGIDKLNTGLILTSALATVVIPFELFLFPYAFKGPLHYLTERKIFSFETAFFSQRSNTLFLLPPLFNPKNISLIFSLFSDGSVVNPSV